jgi:hypothetical protein
MLGWSWVVRKSDPPTDRRREKVAANCRIKVSTPEGRTVLDLNREQLGNVRDALRRGNVVNDSIDVRVLADKISRLLEVG